MVVAAEPVYWKVEVPAVNVAAGEAVITNGVPEPAKIHVLFPAGSTEVVKASRPVLTEVAATMKAHPEIRLVEVQGHADDPGSDAVNERLALRRAETVRTALVKLGVAPARLVAKGYGRRQPLHRGRTADERARNRRVAFQVVPPPPAAR